MLAPIGIAKSFQQKRSIILPTAAPMYQPLAAGLGYTQKSSLNPVIYNNT